MFRSILRDKDGYLLMERYGKDSFEASFWEDCIDEIVKSGGRIEMTYVGTLQTVDTEDGFI